MPVYEFACKTCGQRFEEFTWSSADDNGATCPSCGGSETRKLISVFGIGRAESASAAPSVPCGPGCACHAPAPGRMPTTVS